MLTRIHIENFKSLKDVTLNLQQVNLLIGPNNSGKSNLLKAIEFFKVRPMSDAQMQRLLFKVKPLSIAKIQLDVYPKDDPNIQKIEFEFSISNLGLRPTLVITNKESITNSYDFNGTTKFVPYFDLLEIYKPDPTKFSGLYALSQDQYVEGDCSNLVPFLFNLGQNNKKLFQEIEKGLAECVGDLVGIGTPAVDAPEGSKLRLKFFDKNDNSFWADEVSEGVLYFLALLCIVHQPNPPKLLLLEEPERGIHPRRIREVMDFVFQLAEQKDIQVIMTTHHERVVDYFADIPESVFIFDKDAEGATQVKNLKHDVIEPLDKQYENDGLPKIKFSESLGEHWAAGFMGGVPQ